MEFMPVVAYEIGTTDGKACIALPFQAGTNFQWIPNNGFVGITVDKQTTLDPGGPPGHTMYVVIELTLDQKHVVGQGGFGLAEGGKGPIVKTVPITMRRLYQ